VDPEAIRSAEKNIRLNNLSGDIELSFIPLEQWKDRFTLLTANLTRGVILELFPYFGPVLDPGGWLILSPGGWLILSGILTEQTGDVQDCFPEYGFSEYKALHQAEWACIVAKKIDED
jgi:ribosomal protein L11 methyltransferase